MTIDDLELGLRLTKQAGWNQTESDWLRFMNLEPGGCFVGELDGCSVGTVTTCIFGRVAWIAMVLVDVNARGKGVGTRLLKYCLDYLESQMANRKSQITIRLDATPAGQPIYEKLGLVPEYKLARFEGIGPAGRQRRPRSSQPSAGGDRRRAGEPGTGMVVTKATPENLANIIEFDKLMTDTNRGKMLSKLFEEFPENIRVRCQGNRIEGFVTMRPGANAIQIGPCIARLPKGSSVGQATGRPARRTSGGPDAPGTPGWEPAMSAGRALLSDALGRCAGKPVFVDIPLDNKEAVKVAESSGLKIQRYFMRMCRGERVKDNIKALWASSGPEKG
jgi:GNAT superfamily N-acetyltransferase